MESRTGTGSPYDTSMGWQVAQYDVGMPSSLTVACDQFRSLGTTIGTKLGNTEALAAAAWDSNEWLRAQLDDIEKRFEEAAGNLRGALAKIAARRQKYSEHLKAMEQ